MRGRIKLFKVRMINARLWKNLLNAIATLVDEANFDADDKGITLRAMDPSHVAMVDFEWPHEMFDEYTCDQPLKLCININEMLRFLRRVNADESLELELDEKTAQIIMVLKSKYLRTFKMNTLEALSEEVPSPKITFQSIVKITTSSLKNAINDAATVSDYIIFQSTETEFTMQASGDVGSVEIVIEKDSEEILELDVQENSKAMFGLNYLSDMVKAASSVSDIVTIEFSNNMPVRLNFELPHQGKLQYYLAPRIESSD
jgi:proliferating cell nuclear antigen